MRIFVLFFSNVLLVFSSSLLCNEFIVGNIQGQLGNQLFIIAAATSLALDNDADVYFPDLVNLSSYNIPINREQIFKYQNIDMSTPDEKISYTYREPHFHYDPIPYIPSMAITGYFQSEKYFINHKEEIIQLFSPPQHILDYLESHFKNILCNPKTVAVHHRAYHKESSCYAFLGLEYYAAAMVEFPKDYTFVIFSNDIDWCKQNFKSIPRKLIFMEMGPHHIDFYLMSLCKHQIIGNSSYSWWAAYLNPNPNKKIIAPSKWFVSNHITDTYDLIPQEWKMIP